MRDKLVEQLMQETEGLYVKLIFDIVGVDPSARQKADLLQLWKRSDQYRRFKNVCAKAPDSKEVFIKGLLEKLPQKMHVLLRDWTKEFSGGIGGRRPDFTDTERRQIIQEVRTLQKTLKRPAAIDSVARDWQTTAAKIEGLLKHQSRYKDA